MSFYTHWVKPYINQPQRWCLELIEHLADAAVILKENRTIIYQLQQRIVYKINNLQILTKTFYLKQLFVTDHWECCRLGRYKNM